jgi:hypothetical protein
MYPIAHPLYDTDECPLSTGFLTFSWKSLKSRLRIINSHKFKIVQNHFGESLNRELLPIETPVTPSFEKICQTDLTGEQSTFVYIGGK